MLFFVLSINQDEKKRYNFINAVSYNKLFEALERDALFPIKVIEIPLFFSFVIPLLGAKISTEDVIEIMKNLHLIIKSGVPIYQGILDLTAESDNKKLKNMLSQIADTINRGESLYAAFEPYKDIVGVMVLNLIKIGEETGELALTLERGAFFLNRINSLKKKVKSALIYPAFAFASVLGTMIVWMVYVLPQMTQLFTYMNIELPPLTIFIITVSEFFSKYVLYMIGTFIGVTAIFRIAHKEYKTVRWYTDKYILKIPVLKHIIVYFNTAFISEYLKLALVSGIPIVNALNTLDKNIENELFQKALQDITKNVAQGTQLSLAFSNTKMFPSFMMRMMNIGESTGTLDSQLDLVANNYYEKVDYFAENIGKVIEPVVLIIVGGFMAFVMASLIGPMYDLISKVQ